jgi:hypothetical protein
LRENNYIALSVCVCLSENNYIALSVCVCLSENNHIALSVCVCLRENNYIALSAWVVYVFDDHVIVELQCRRNNVEHHIHTEHGPFDAFPY